ncbi:MAG: hypothetical protein HKN10_10470 [Myxococcales bacterium]|nr:hypothetical protein [Myxococcales bacterium]
MPADPRWPLAALVSVLSMLVSNASMAQPDEQGSEKVEAQQADAEAGEPEEEPKNGLLFGFTHAFRLIQEQGSGGESASRRNEQVYGFLFGYERVLHRYLALSIIKPFYFNRELVESPLEIVVSGIYRKNGWEPFLGAGVISTIASIRSEGEVESVEFSVGLIFVTGFKYFFSRNWAIELEFAYEYVPKGTSREHALGGNYQGAYFF